MTGRRLLLVVSAIVGPALVWVLLVFVPQWFDLARPIVDPPRAADPSIPERKIKARLFYVTDDGHALSGVERDVSYAADPAAQARAILEAQLAPPEPPFQSAVPARTALRAVFVANGEAYVDLSGDVVTGHPGGSLNERLTVQTVVNAVTTNLPAVTSVQILIDGKEVDTLAGHMDLRQPLLKTPTASQ